MAAPRTRPPYDLGYDFEEPLYADSPAVSPDRPEPTPWWELGPERPAPPTPPSRPRGSPSGFHPGALTGQRMTGYGETPATDWAVSGSRPSPRGVSKRSLRQVNQEQRQLAEKRRQEQIEWQRKQIEKQNKLEREKFEAMKKLQEKKLALMKFQTLKPAWGI